MSGSNRGANGAKRVGGSVAAGAGIVLAALGFVIPLVAAGPAIFFGSLGIVSGIAGYTLGVRRSACIRR